MIKKVVVYPYVTSFVLVSYLSKKIEIIKEGDSHFNKSLGYFFWSFFLGWWSVHGFLRTLWALPICLKGGVDVTDIYKKYLNNPHLQEVSFDTYFWKEYDKKWFV